MTQEFWVTGMACKVCAGKVETATKNVAGVTAVNVDLAAGKLTVEGNVDPAAILAAVGAIGFQISR